MTHVADHVIAGPLRRPRAPLHAARPAAAAVRCRDERWPAVAAALAALRAARRRSVRIVDADCGGGALLLCAARHARALGFTAIEARGIDRAPWRVERARASAVAIRDAAIDITFETADVVDALDAEAQFPADIVMWHGRSGTTPEEARAVACAGRMLIADAKIAA